jgi:hypothetical protein
VAEQLGHDCKPAEWSLQIKDEDELSGNDGSWPNHYFNVFTVSFSSLPRQDHYLSILPSGAAIWLDGGSTVKSLGYSPHVTAGSQR